MSNDKVLGGEEQLKSKRESEIDDWMDFSLDAEINDLMRDLFEQQIDQLFQQGIADSKPSPDAQPTYPPKEDGSDSHVPYGNHMTPPMPVKVMIWVNADGTGLVTFNGSSWEPFDVNKAIQETK